MDATSGGGGGGPVRVLLVEGDPLLALATGLALRAAGHDVVGVAGSEAAARDLAAAVARGALPRPDLALVDARLGRAGGCGLRAAAALRGAAGVPSLLVTGAPPPPDPPPAGLARLGVVGVVAKPCAPDSLLAAVRRAAAAAKTRSRQTPSTSPTRG